MKLLILTQKMDKNDPILGFFHRWVEEFAKNVESVTVICLEEGRHSLPSNVRVLSLGKESGKSKLKYVIRFYRYIWQERKNYDAVFVHMNQVYVILGAMLWRLLGKKIGLWYMHKHTDWQLRLAVKLTHKIFTGSRESFRLESKKVSVMGHGIDVNTFHPDRVSDGGGRLISVGRISPVKNEHLMVGVVKLLRESGHSVELLLIGTAVTDKDKEYEENIKAKVVALELNSLVTFSESVANHRLPEIYKKRDILINLADTGSLDKAVLEAMALGIHVLTSNEAFHSFLPEQNITTKDLDEVAKKVMHLLNITPQKELMEHVVERHSLANLISSLVSKYEAINR